VYKIQNVDKEITEKVDWLESHNGEVLHKDWLVNAVVADHADITGDDADFALCTARYAVLQRVERYFRKIKENENTQEDPQMLLPGYQKLQSRYLVERAQEQVAVSIWIMTDDEIDWKADQHRAMGKGHFEHANELLRFKDSRAEKAEA